ncbi:MAG: sigma-70 family RNA polymerase sigma factor, partial [Synechococcaceae cyanobacterium SM2_3_2]|nr:sigma-70 family RNA polymerase sigma factor [Synechococcaceae cyanobacterium SM2_3_2]
MNSSPLRSWEAVAARQLRTLQLSDTKTTLEKTHRQEKTVEILAAYRRCPSVHLRNHLVELNSGLVRRIAHRFSQQSTVPYEDLEQLGSLGLIRAIERFDPQHGFAFSSFAVPYIRGEMLHYLRDQSTMVRIPRRWQSLQRQGQQMMTLLSAELGRTPSDGEVATALGVSVQDWRSAKQLSSVRCPSAWMP